jgi:hypothetical protein
MSIILLFLSFITNSWQVGYDFIDQQKQNLESMAETVFGEYGLFLMGYYPQKGEIAVYGKGEISSHLRVTAINGILNQKEDWQAFMQLISESHGNINVHSVFWASEGWSNDVYRATIVKSGTPTEASQLLSLLWRQMIEEMGGIDGPGVILHFAHSIGAAETHNAKLLMTPQECAKIKVVTFGSPYLFPNEDFLSVTHYVSYRDGVSLLDMITYVEAMNANHEHIIFIGSPYEGLPLIDHFVRFGTYKDQILRLGEEFVHEYEFML